MKNLFYSIVLMLLFSGTAWAQLSGERIVPSSDYPDIQTVADSLNLYGVGADGISFMLQDGSTFEESPIEFTASGTLESEVYIGWNGEGVKPVINFTGTAADGEAGISLAGADYYTFDGIKITNSNSDLEFGILITNLDGQNGAHYNTVKNVEIILDKLNVNSTSAVVVNALIAPTTSSGNNNYNKFFNNRISNASIGYSFDGGTSETPLMSVGNEVGTEGDGESTIIDVVMAGVTASDQNGFIFSNTTIRDVTRIGTGTGASAAIATSSGNPSEPLTNEIIISNNTIENMTSSFTSIFGMYLSARKVTYHISNNKIYNVTATGGGGNTADGIMLLATDATANIYNNMVSAIAAPGSAVNNNSATRGITVRTYAQANIFYNTVLLDYVATNPAHISAAMVVYNNSDPVQMRNNIFVNKTILADDATGLATAVYKRNNNLTGIMLGTNNNIYYAGVPGPQNLIFYGHNSSAPLILQTIEDYMSETIVFDNNSYTEDVPFIAFNDLHIVAFANTVASNNAGPISEPFSIDSDIDGNLRNTETPDIGADEIASILPDVAINPNPEDGATDVMVSLSELSWEYVTGSEFTNPETFLVYFGTSPDFDGATPIASIIWEEGVTNYSAPIDGLQPETVYYWQVAPITDPDNGETPETVAVWMFTTGISIIEYPNAVENPSPANGETVELTADHIITFGWDYNPSTEHLLPVFFEVYGTSDINNTNWENPIGVVNYVAGQVAYEIELTDNPNFIYEEDMDNFWKVVPVALNGAETPDVEVWTFTFDETIGLNELLPEGTSIFPNPAYDFVNIEPGFEGKYEVILYDVQGRQIQHFGEGEGIRRLDLASIPSGAYQMAIRQGASQFVNLIKVK